MAPTVATSPAAAAGRLGCLVLLVFLAGCEPGPTPAPAGPTGTASTPDGNATGWVRRSDAPIALTEVAAAAFDGRIWLAGGLTAGGAGSTDVLVYNPATDAWSAGPALPEPVHHAALVSDGTALWLVGGYVGDGFDRPTAAVRRLDPDDGTWRDDVFLPEPRAAGAAAWDGQRIVYAGGVQPGALASEVFALEGETWRRIGRLPNAREHLAATSDGAGSTYVLGGRAGGLGGNLAVVDLVSDDEVATIGQVPTPRGGVAAFWWPDLGACLVGGESPGGTNPEVECIDADGKVTRLAGLGHARHGLGAAVVDGTAFVLLGGDRPGLFVSATVEALELP